jgi:hypothetical protein
LPVAIPVVTGTDTHLHTDEESKGDADSYPHTDADPDLDAYTHQHRDAYDHTLANQTLTPSLTPTATLEPSPAPEPADFASVGVDSPKVALSSGASRPWTYNIVFHEYNGSVAACTMKRIVISAPDGSMWGDEDYWDNYGTYGQVTINIPAFGSDSYKTWINSLKSSLWGATIVIAYLGEDEYGNAMQAGYTTVMQQGVSGIRVSLCYP